MKIENFPDANISVLQDGGNTQRFYSKEIMSHKMAYGS
jgi:hypothetical protein